MMRLQKMMASSGVASRRKSEELILEGRVKVNGELVTELGFKVDENKDSVEVDGKIINISEKHVYYILHKPERIVSSAKDEKGRKTVVDMIESEARLYPVGRLDFMSSGLIILTNDGDLTYKLTHPKHDITKTYEVTISPCLNAKQVSKLRSGVAIDGRKTYPCQVHLLKQSGNRQTYNIILKEGRNRQIRKMVEAVGSNVIKLKRIAVGDITLKGLDYGEYRKLSKAEVKYLKRI